MRLFSYTDRLVRKIRKEPQSNLDRARHLSVSTGRLEPYLRQLATETLYFYHDSSSKSYFRTTHENGTFIHAYTTPARLEGYHRGVLHIDNDMRTSGGFHDNVHDNFHKSNIRSSHILDYLKTNEHNTHGFALAKKQLSDSTLYDSHPGLRIDPLTGNELTIESHHFPTIISLGSGAAIPEALSPIGQERLEASAPHDHDDLDTTICAALSSLRLRGGDDNRPAQLMRVNVELKGFGGRSFPTYFIAYDPHDPGAKESFASLDSAQIQALVSTVQQPVIIVNPADADWRRDLLWEYRLDASFIDCHS